MNAQQLKNAILQEAIEGRLVPQDPNDEPASVLLQRIRQEKQRLVKEGKLKKKDLEEKPISEDEKPFEIPDSWEWCRIGSLFSMQAGKNVTSAEIQEEKSEKYPYPCYGGNGLRGYVKCYNTKGCFPLVGRQGALCGNIRIAEGEFWATEHAVVTNGFGQTEIMWQFYFLTALNLNKLATATAQPGLAVSNILEALIPLPPLAEQRRIVAKIKELLPKVEEYGKAQEALDKLNEELPEKLKKSILQEAIEGRLVPQDPNDEPASVLLDRIRQEKQRLVKEGKLKKKDLEEKPISEDEIPFEIPESWEWVRLGDVCDYIHRGKSPKYGIKKVLPIIAQKCNQWDKIYTDRCLFSDIANIEKYTSEQYLQVGDVIINSTGGGTVGRTGIVENYVFDTYPQYVADSHITVVRGNRLITSKYIYYFLISPFIQFGLEDRCSGSTNQIELGTNTICDYLFPLPPLVEQHRIVAKIEELFKEIDKLKVK